MCAHFLRNATICEPVFFHCLIFHTVGTYFLYDAQYTRMFLYHSSLNDSTFFIMVNVLRIFLQHSSSTAAPTTETNQALISKRETSACTHCVLCFCRTLNSSLQTAAQLPWWPWNASFHVNINVYVDLVSRSVSHITTFTTHRFLHKCCSYFP